MVGHTFECAACGARQVGGQYTRRLSAVNDNPDSVETPPAYSVQSLKFPQLSTDRGEMLRAAMHRLWLAATRSGALRCAGLLLLLCGCASDGGLWSLVHEEQR